MGVGIPLPKPNTCIAQLGRAAVSKTEGWLGSIPPACATYLYSSMDRTTNYGFVDRGSSPLMDTKR